MAKYVFDQERTGQSFVSDSFDGDNAVTVILQDTPFSGLFIHLKLPRKTYSPINHCSCTASSITFLELYINQIYAYKNLIQALLQLQVCSREGGIERGRNRDDGLRRTMTI
jgi:hypothetical protein